ncbi:hypothetical protein AVEN_234808-1 [Araneus ventricosus]|uniref:Uncharacterized protein n=1 Tax=Araneus ventricosus TaxID=182803 RepID=A0A4Y2F9Z1_ARAVE|nr:hypothetical protein AVEN_234808-1 [Araneus ventricosus]
MELAASGHADGIWNLKTAIDTFQATSDVLSLAGNYFIFDGNSEVGLQASTLCLLNDQVGNKPFLLKVSFRVVWHISNLYGLPLLLNRFCTTKSLRDSYPPGAYLLGF